MRKRLNSFVSKAPAGGLCLQVRFTQAELEHIVAQADEYKMSVQKYIIAASTDSLPEPRTNKKPRSRGPRGVKEK